MSRRAGAVVALGFCIFGLAQPARAQGPPQLVPLLTDQTPIALSNQFGQLISGGVNDAGDYAFLAGRALFYRRAGWGAPVRVIQSGDEVPGFPGSRANQPVFFQINQSGLIAFTVDFVAASGRRLAFLGTFDGTTIVPIASGADTAPGTGGAHYEANMALFDLNDAGDIAFSSNLLLPGTIGARPTLFLIPAGGAPVRLTGFGDAAPGTGGTFSAISNSSTGNNPLTQSGEVLFQGTISGGLGGFGLFVASTGGVRKIVSNGDPNPLGGAFAITGVVTSRINSLGEVAFAAANAVWVDTPGSGISAKVAPGNAVPAPIGGTFGVSPTLQAFNDAGEIAFVGNVSASVVSSSALFRYRPALPVEIVAYRNQVFSGAPAFGAFAAVSMNSAGVIGFRGSTIGSVAVPAQSIGIFRHVSGSSLEGLALDGQASPFGGTYDFDTTGTTQTVAGGAVYAQADLPNASARYAEFLFSTGAALTLMSTADSLPAGARVDLFSGWIDGAGDYVGFTGRRPGGSNSLLVHHITTNATTVVATDGDTAPDTGGGVLNLLNFSRNFVNAAGQSAFLVQVIGGAGSVRTGIFAASVGGGLSKIAVDGDLDGDGRVLSAMSLITLSPKPINDAGQIVFAAMSGTARGVFIGTIGATPLRVARVGDMTSTGQPITSLTGPQPSINAAGQVAFLATTASGVGLFVGAPGSVPVKVAQAGNAAPGGGTFVAFGVPSFNTSGELAFMATTSGGNGGIFVGSASAAPIALALNGQAAPAGGIYSMTVARPDVVINDAHDVSFLSDLTGGSANSGYFIRRGASGSVTTLVLQGDPVPGTSETFMTFAHTLNTAVGEFNQISDTGDVAVFGRFPAGGLNLSGTWRVKTDNTVEEILARGSIAPAFGGGTAVIGSQMSTWLSGSRYPTWARVSGGSFIDGIFLFVPPATGAPTPAGPGIIVTPPDATSGTSPVTLTFDSVTTAGETTVTTSAGAPAIPTAFALGDPPVFYNLTTTAEFAGAITVCVDFSATTFPSGSTLRLLHLVGGVWQDVTSSGPVDDVICGVVTSLSPFAVVRVANRPPIAVAGADQTLPCCGPTGAPVTLNGTGSSDPDNDTLTYVWRDEHGVVVGNAATVVVTLTPGSYTFALTVTDPAGLNDTAETHVLVQNAALTITADNQTRVLGAANPTFTASYAGFFGGETPAALTGTLTCTTTAGPTSPVGVYPITCTGQTSDHYDITYVAGTLTVAYAAAGEPCGGQPGHIVLQPVNADGTSVFNQKSTVPIKFRVCGTDGSPVTTPGVVTDFRLVAVIAGTVVSSVNEAAQSTTPDTAFRSEGPQWIFNLSTKNLLANRTYVYRITLNDGSTMDVRFGLK